MPDFALMIALFGRASKFADKQLSFSNMFICAHTMVQNLKSSLLCWLQDGDSKGLIPWRHLIFFILGRSGGFYGLPDNDSGHAVHFSDSDFPPDGSIKDVDEQDA